MRTHGNIIKPRISELTDAERDALTGATFAELDARFDWLDYYPVVEGERVTRILDIHSAEIDEYDLNDMGDYLTPRDDS